MQYVLTVIMRDLKCYTLSLQKHKSMPGSLHTFPQMETDHRESTYQSVPLELLSYPQTCVPIGGGHFSVRCKSVYFLDFFNDDCQLFMARNIA